MAAVSSTSRSTLASKVRAWGIRVLMALCVGQFITVLIAWACAAFVTVQKVPGSDDDPYWVYPFPSHPTHSFQDFYPAEYQGFGVSFASRTFMMFLKGPEDWYHVCSNWDHVTKTESWEKKMPEPRDGALVMLQVTRTASGWPYRALIAQIYHPNYESMPENEYGWPTQYAVVSGDALRKTNVLIPGLQDWFPFLKRGNVGLARSIPITPIWPQYTYNTLFWASIFFVIAFVPRLLRHYRRARRNACLHCGYTLAGLPKCPECGTIARPPAAATQINPSPTSVPHT